MAHKFGDGNPAFTPGSPGQLLSVVGSVDRPIGGWAHNSRSSGSNMDPNIVIAIVVVSLALPLALFVFLIRRGRARMRQQQQLLATGIPAKARILAMQHGGAVMTIGVQRSISLVLSLEVHMQARAPYTTQAQKFVSELILSQFQPGAWLDVRVDPSNPNHLEIAGPSSPTF